MEKVHRLGNLRAALTYCRSLLPDLPATTVMRCAGKTTARSISNPHPLHFHRACLLAINQANDIYIHHVARIRREVELPVHCELLICRLLCPFDPNNPVASTSQHQRRWLVFRNAGALLLSSNSSARNSNTYERKTKGYVRLDQNQGCWKAIFESGVQKGRR